MDVAGVDGLALAGDWVGPDGLLADASILSGLAAARHVLATARRTTGAPVRQPRLDVDPDDDDLEASPPTARA